MNCEQPTDVNSLWLAYAPDKQAWKANGNYYSPQELQALEKAFADLKIAPCPEPVLSAD